MQFLQSLILHYAQLLWVLLVLPFAFGLLLYILARGARSLFVNAGAESVDIYLTGWIGVPLHELGHALFCVIFNHKITDIQLFKPDKNDGTLGYVTHSYNPKNWYQAVGNFFIGCGPIILGALMLYFITVLFFSDTFVLQKMSLIPQKNISFVSFFTTIWHFLQQAFVSFLQFFKQQNFSSWQFWVYMYLSLAISSHMELSLPDIRTMLRGLLVLCAILLLSALVAEVFDFSLAAMFSSSLIMNYLYALLLFAICVSTLNFVITFVITRIIRLFR